MSRVFKGLAKRRFLLATIAAVTVFGAVYGFAASLNLTSNKLSAGNATVASCQSTSPNATYTVSYNATTGDYDVASVVVTGLDSACGSKPMNVTLQGSGNTSLGEITGTVPAGGGSLTLTPSGSIHAKDVVGVSAAING
jgi:hypothetical protein